MNKLLCMVPCMLVLLGAPLSESQTIADYDAHLARLQKNVTEWRTQIEAVDPATIVVPYHIGKLIEDSKKALLQNLQLVSFLAANIPTKPRLSAEIELVGLLKEVRSNMNDLNDILVGMVGSDQKVAVSWAEQIGTIAQGPLNQEAQYQTDAVEKFADDLEARCGH